MARARLLGRGLRRTFLGALGPVDAPLDRSLAPRGAPPDAPVTVRALTGTAADELINASEDADLLVVGARGAGGFARLVLGSVSTQVTHHALCPVVVVPGNRKE